MPAVAFKLIVDQTDGHIFGQSTTSPDLQLLNTDEMISDSRLVAVGPNTLADILVDDGPCCYLLDTQWFTSPHHLAQGFYWKHLSHTPLQPVDSCLKVTGAGGQQAPYLGYISVHVTLPHNALGDSQCFSILAHVVPETSFHAQAPVLLSTNLL
jgi:hypothetical protein